MKKASYLLLLIVIIFTLTSCKPSSSDTKKVQETNNSKSKISFGLDVKSSHSALMKIMGIEVPESFKSEYSGYDEGKLPFYWSITFGDYEVSLMYIPSVIAEYAANTGETEIPITALSAKVMSITGSGENVRSDELQDCIVNISSTNDSLTFDFEISADCNIDLNEISEYKIDVLALGDFQTKTFNIEEVSDSKISMDSPNKRNLKVTLIDERTAEFRLTDPDIESFYQVGPNLIYEWQINFRDSKNDETRWEVFARTPYLDTLSSLSISQMAQGFSRNGASVGYIENGEKGDSDIDFKLDGKTMVWKVHYPEYFRLGEDYDTSSFDFRNFDNFSVSHFTIENNTAQNIYDDNYSAKEIIYDNDFIENYNIKPIPEQFSASGDGENFAPISTNYVICEKMEEAYHPVFLKDIALYSLDENGIVIGECHKWECDSTKDLKFLMYGEVPDSPALGRLITIDVINSSGKTIYFKPEFTSIAYLPENLLDFKGNCNKDGYAKDGDTTIYFSKH